jgi:MFS family permease
MGQRLGFWLLAARVLQGVATGVATSTLSAVMIDQERDRGALLNSVAPMLGMALGLGLAVTLIGMSLHTTAHLLGETVVAGLGFG